MSRLAKELALTIKLEPMDLIRVGNRKLSYDEFQDCLDIYENNQMVYSNDTSELLELEKWFSSIREPYPEAGTEMDILSWRERERRRRKYKVSDYCNKDIRKMLLELRK